MDHQFTCTFCGTESSTRSKSRIACSDIECVRKHRRVRQARREPCIEEGCSEPRLAGGLCPTHYSAATRGQKKHTVKCAECGVTAAVDRKAMKYCSTQCANVANNRLAVAKTLSQREPKIGQCGWCYAMVLDQGKYCGDGCRRDAATARARARRSPIRAAIEDGQALELLRVVREMVVVQDSGCWEWTGQIKDGYPICKWGGRDYGIHRAVIEAKRGAPLGSQAAHHQCANTRCVNPDHLQPVTHRENTAEMLARRSYLARISELEAALAAVAPGHPLLGLISVA